MVIREVCLLGLAGVYHSAAAAVARTTKVSRERVAMPRRKLEQAHRHEVVITTRQGRVRIGRLIVKERHVELHQVVRGIPCRHRYSFNDVISCYISDDEQLSTITRDVESNSNRPGPAWASSELPSGE